MAIKFNRHHVTDGTRKARVHYSINNRIDRRSCVTLYAKDYDSGDSLCAIFNGEGYINDTDIQTDYFDKGRLVLFEDSPHYQAALARAKAIESEWEQKRGAR